MDVRQDSAHGGAGETMAGVVAPRLGEETERFAALASDRNQRPGRSARGSLGCLSQRLEATVCETTRVDVTQWHRQQHPVFCGEKQCCASRCNALRHCARQDSNLRPPV